MKRFILIAAALLCLALPTFAQDEEEVALPDTVMKQVIRRIVTFYFKPRRTPTTIYLDGENVKAEWLPEIRNIRFVIVHAAELETPRKGFRIEPMSIDGTRYTAKVGAGTLGCPSTGSGDKWSFVFRSDRVHLWKDKHLGWGWRCARSGYIS